MYKHYIKIDNDDNITDSFSSWQHEKFDGSEIYLEDSFDRHFNLDVYENEIYKYKLQGKKIKEKTKKQKDDEKALLPVYKSDVQKLIDVLISKGVILKSDLNDKTNS